MNINKYVDYTNLKAVATKEDIERLCKEAVENKYYSVCVNPCRVKLARKTLDSLGEDGKTIKVACVCGFPLGANSADIKRLEAKKAIEDGAKEIDMVINIGLLKEGNYKDVLEDIKGVVSVVKEKQAITKVIIETCYLSDNEKEMACEISLDAGAEYVKTSTGFGSGGATIKDVALMKNKVLDAAKVKASGGIKTKEDVEAFIKEGASRIGASWIK